MQRFSAVILAAGQGVRMQSKLAKVLHPLAGEPMIHYVVDACQHLPVEWIIVVVGHQAEQVEEALAGRRVKFVRQSEQRGTAHALLQAENALQGFEGDLLVLSGDVPLVREATLKKLIEEHRKGEAVATILTAELPDPKGYGRVLRDSDGSFLRVVEEAEASPEELRVTEVNAGVYCFASKPLFPALKEVEPAAVKKELYIPGALEILRRWGLRILTVRAEDPTEVVGINSRADLVKADWILRQRILSRLMSEGVTILAPEVTYISPFVKIGQDVVIYPHVFLEGRTEIGEGVRIYPHCRIRDSRIGDRTTILDGCIILESEVAEDCQVGPYAHLRLASKLKRRARVGNFVEVKKSVVGEGSKVPHLSYVGDATIGDHVNVGAGTITCNYDGFQKHKTIIEDDVFVGSNTSLVAPVRVGKGAIIAAGSTITEDVPPDALALGRAPQVNKEGRAEETRKKRKAMAKPSKEGS